MTVVISREVEDNILFIIRLLKAQQIITWGLVLSQTILREVGYFILETFNGANTTWTNTTVGLFNICPPTVIRNVILVFYELAV